MYSLPWLITNAHRIPLSEGLCSKPKNSFLFGNSLPAEQPGEEVQYLLMYLFSEAIELQTVPWGATKWRTEGNY